MAQDDTRCTGRHEVAVSWHQDSLHVLNDIHGDTKAAWNIDLATGLPVSSAFHQHCPDANHPVWEAEKADDKKLMTKSWWQKMPNRIIYQSCCVHNNAARCSNITSTLIHIPPDAEAHQLCCLNILSTHSLRVRLCHKIVHQVSLWVTKIIQLTNDHLLLLATN